MALKNQILTISQPKVALKAMSIADLDAISTTVSQSEVAGTLADGTGTITPLVMINGIIIEGGMILSMTIKQESFLPTMTLSFVDSMGLFTSYHNPIFEPIVSVYVKSQTPQIKPFRGDYLITNIRSAPMFGDSQHMITLDCELYVPNLYNNVSKSYPDMTSIDCLKRVANELNLGFATNETQTSDKMTWLNPNLSYYNFIRNEVTKRAYKSDKSFFTCFIDRYYILNFFDVEKQMQQDTEFDMSYFTMDSIPNSGNLSGADDRAKEFELTLKVTLSNHPLMQGNSNHIQEFWPISDNGEILKLNSFRRRAIWYDSKNEKINSFFVEPLSNSRTLTGSVHQVPEMSDLRTMEVKKWLGLDFGNAHQNSKFAKILNHHNSAEMSKNLICARVHGFNSTILRGTRLPVTLYDDLETNTLKSVMEGNADQVNDEHSFRIDKALSDIYYVKDIIYKYDALNQASPFSTEFILSKRNWKKTSIK